MKFKQPTDSKILVFLYYSASSTVGEIAIIVERHEDYVSNRLADMAYYGYVTKPHEQRGFYRLEPQGVEYVDDLDDDLHPQDLDQIREYIPEMIERANIDYGVTWGESEVRHPEWFDA